MGIATILQARRIVLIATGAAKAAIVERLLRGPMTTGVPGSFLQLHPDVEIVHGRGGGGRSQGVLIDSRRGASGADVLADRHAHGILRLSSAGAAPAAASASSSASRSPP